MVTISNPFRQKEEPPLPVDNVTAKLEAMGITVTNDGRFDRRVAKKEEETGEEWTEEMVNKLDISETKKAIFKRMIAARKMVNSYATPYANPADSRGYFEKAVAWKEALNLVIGICLSDTPDDHVIGLTIDILMNQDLMWAVSFNKGNSAVDKAYAFQNFNQGAQRAQFDIVTHDESPDGNE